MLHHVALTTNQPNAMVLFYRDGLGLTFVSDWDRPDEGVSGQVREFSGGGRLEIITSYRKGAAGPGYGLDRVGINHFGISVPSVDAALAKAIANGGTLGKEPRDGRTVKRLAFVNDPDGNSIELVELAG